MDNEGQRCALGCQPPKLAIYIANKPEIAPYSHRVGCYPLVKGEVQHIAFNTSNHWRKIFNVYAKFWYGLSLSCPSFSSRGAASWQDYRDRFLLQAGSDQALVFTPPNFDAECIHIVAGKSWAQKLALESPTLRWLDAYFAIDENRRLIVCPYLDYRQLSNERIDKLIQLVVRLEASMGLQHDN